MGFSNRSRTKYSFLNAGSAVALTLTNGLLGMVVTRLVLRQYGSDFNGLNSTANQIINVLLMFEGGFTLASNVSLFDHVTAGRVDVINGILSATKRRFRIVGFIFLISGVSVSFIYSLIVKTSLDRELVFTIILLAVVPQAFNFFWTITYRVLLQAQQKEYVINISTALTICGGHLTNVVVVLLNKPMWVIRFVTMVFSVINCLVIAHYVRSKEGYVDLHVKPMSDQIHGTSDVIIQRVTGVIYSSWPIVFLSVLSKGGTVQASVYSVYNSVFVMVKSLLHAVIDAPRLGFGQMFTEQNKEEVWKTFKEYEFIASSLIFFTIITIAGIILPFVRFYTRGISDVNYYNPTIAVLLILITTIEMWHIPSGHIINMSGHFKISKNFQLIACAMLIVSMSLLGTFYGIYGVLASLLITAILLAILEIGYVHKLFFMKRLRDVISVFFPYIFVGIIIVWFEMYLSRKVESVWMLIVLAAIYAISNIVIDLSIGFVFNRTEAKSLLMRFMGLKMKD